MPNKPNEKTLDSKLGDKKPKKAINICLFRQKVIPLQRNFGESDAFKGVAGCD